MTGMAAGCRDIRLALGAYVLGAIDPAERSMVDDHLATCADCREELAGLAALPALLRRVPVAEAERLADRDLGGTMDEVPSDHLLGSLIARVAEVRRTHMWRSAMVAAAVVVLVLTVGAAGGIAVHSLVRSAPAATATLHSWRTVSGTDPGSGVGVTVRYAPTAWGTTMAVQVTGLQAGTACQFQITDSAGHTRVLGRWRVGYGSPAAWYPVSTSATATSLRRFEVASGGTVVASVRVP